MTLYMMLKKIQMPPDFPQPSAWALYNFGAPRVGDKHYADYLNSQEKINMTRVVNFADLVCHLPFAGEFGAVHHGPELWLKPGYPEGIVCSKKYYEDAACSNSLGATQPYNLKDHLFYWDVAYLKC